MKQKLYDKFAELLGDEGISLKEYWRSCIPLCPDTWYIWRCKKKRRPAYALLFLQP